MEDKGRNWVDWTLIRKWMDGGVSDEEGKRLEGWMAKDVVRRRFVENARRYYRKELPRVDQDQVDQAWTRFMHPRGKRRPLNVISWWARGIAAAMLVVAGVWLAWDGEDEPVRLVRHEIMRGERKACLILSDGTEVELQSLNGSRRVTDKEMNILLDSTTVTYESVGKNMAEGNNTIRIPRGGEYHLTLSDGTRVWLNAQSELVYPVAFQGGERRVSLRGEAYFEVTPGKGRFIVETGQMDVRVLGTAFNVNAYEDEGVVRTTLVHGKVEILAEGQTARTLIPGEQSAWDRESGRLEVSTVDVSLFTQWKEGRFVFRDNTLRDIMRTLGRWYDMEYQFTNPEQEELRFYGVIGRFENVQSLLAQFEKTGKVKFEYQGNKVIIK